MKKTKFQMVREIITLYFHIKMRNIVYTRNS